MIALAFSNTQFAIPEFNKATKFKIDSAIESLNTHIAEMGYSGSAEDDD